MFQGLSGKVKKNNEIGFIASWGPLFRVSFDLKINSLVQGDPTWGWANIFAFGQGVNPDQKNGNGERVPAIFIHRYQNLGLYFANSVNGNGNYHHTYTQFQLEKWQHYIIEQTRTGEKVWTEYSPKFALLF